MTFSESFVYPSIEKLLSYLLRLLVIDAHYRFQGRSERRFVGVRRPCMCDFDLRPSVSRVLGLIRSAAWPLNSVGQNLRPITCNFGSSAMPSSPLASYRTGYSKWLPVPETPFQLEGQTSHMDCLSSTSSELNTLLSDLCIRIQNDRSVDRARSESTWPGTSYLGEAIQWKLRVIFFVLWSSRLVAGVFRTCEIDSKWNLASRPCQTFYFRIWQGLLCG